MAAKYPHNNSTKKASITSTPTGSIGRCQMVTNKSEGYILVWLDKDVNTNHENQQIQQIFRESNDQLKAFDNADKCVNYLVKSTDQRIIIIVSNSLGCRVVSIIQDLEQVAVVYVYCYKTKVAEEWARGYEKVKGIFSQAEELVAAVSSHQRIYDQIDDDAIVMSIYEASNVSEDRVSKNVIFVYFQLLIGMLLNMMTNQNSTAKEDLIEYLKKKVSNEDEVQKQQITEFGQNYTSSDAILWYTKPTILYRTLNKALRQSNYEALFALRLFIKDLHKQLTDEHNKFLESFSSSSNSILCVYRGTTIANKDLQYFRQNIGRFLCMQNFLSTSTEVEIAKRFAQQAISTADSFHILLRFNIDISKTGTRPYADIKHLSYYYEEKEIMIMMGSIFKIEEVEFNEREQTWIAILNLCSENEYRGEDWDWERGKKVKTKPVLSSFVEELLRKNKLGGAYEYFEQELSSRSISNFQRANYYGELGDILFYGNKEYDVALKMYHQQLALLSTHEGAALGIVRCKIGEVYWHKKDQVLALSHAQKALDILMRFNYPELSHVCYLIAHIFDTEQKLNSDVALQRYELETLRREYTENHRITAFGYIDIGAIYHGYGKFEKALEYYQKAKEIFEHLSPPYESYSLDHKISCANDKRLIDD